MKKSIKDLMEIINSSDNIVFFGGAGVSTASGIPDFRSSKGIYSHTPEEVLSYDFFLMHTKEFYDFFWENLVYEQAKPNPCHYFLVELEKKKKLKGIITQNIDGLHQMAGSKNVIELHGNIKTFSCIRCHRKYSIEVQKKNKQYFCDNCGSLIKPDIVLYGENLDESTLEKSIDLISNCDTLIIAGTSLKVYPAAGLIHFFSGKNLVLIDKNDIVIPKNGALFIKDAVENVLNTKNL